RRLGQRRSAAALGQRDLRRDDTQVVPTLQRLEDVVAGAVEDLRVVVTEDERRVPVETIGWLALLLFGGPDAGAFAGAQVAAAHPAFLGPGITKAGSLRIDPAHKPVAAADRYPALVDGAGAVKADAGAAPAAFVLQPAVDVIRPLVADRDVV